MTRMQVATYAAQSDASRGRVHAEPTPPGRSEFQRDRDRIVHATAFRKLLYKTQVFVNHEGDLYRTRLTHSLEVAQIARSVARRLALDEELTEAICLAHDLGHTPFGHAGQHALNECLKRHDPEGEGFEHNLQSLRVVDQLERRYAEFDGLNLCFETREGILKHCSRRAALKLGELAQRFLEGGSPTLEAQLANVSDEVAYNHHDLDDGLRSGLLSLDQILVLPMVKRHFDAVHRRFPKIQGDRVVPEMIRAMINEQVDDLVAQTRAHIQSHGVETLSDVRRAPPLVAFSSPLAHEVKEVKQFLFQNLYRHPRVVAVTDVAEGVLKDLFAWHFDRAQCQNDPDQSSDQLLRQVADEVAGLTDRQAMLLHDQVFPGRAQWPHRSSSGD
ncbi:Dgt dGTP triphosphohydrolase [Burkholderiales bacterium]